jgi:hypothetical protein
MEPRGARRHDLRRGRSAGRRSPSASGRSRCAAPALPDVRSSRPGLVLRGARQAGPDYPGTRRRLRDPHLPGTRFSRGRVTVPSCWRAASAARRPSTPPRPSPSTRRGTPRATMGEPWLGFVMLGMRRTVAARRTTASVLPPGRTPSHVGIGPRSHLLLDLRPRLVQEHEDPRGSSEHVVPRFVVERRHHLSEDHAHQRLHGGPDLGPDFNPHDDISPR